MSQKNFQERKRNFNFLSSNQQHYDNNANNISSVIPIPSANGIPLGVPLPLPMSLPLSSGINLMGPESSGIYQDPSLASNGLGLNNSGNNNNNNGVGVDDDFLEITPLGSGCEVGRSCHLLKFKGKQILLDMGIHPAYTGIAALPYLDEIDPGSIDILLITHFHLDHAAALPYFLTQTNFKGRVFMTHPTKSIYKLILQDYVKVSSLSVDENLYSEKDLINSMDKIETVNYHQVVHHRGIKFWAYNAGHVLGAAMFMIEIAGIRILYTGDYSRRDDRHLMGAETPNMKPHVLIIESTYGVQTLPPVAEREARFTETVKNIVLDRRGRCLLPVFALGRAQEVLLILDEFWEANNHLHAIPIYYASALARKCITVYQTYMNMMNKRIQALSQISNPFVFKHITNLKGMENFDDDGPCVIMASPGMLQNGLSRELLELWCQDSRNGCVITGYSVEGTLAKQIMAEPTHITSLNGQKLPFNMTVNYISFSAHADYGETSEFIQILRPPNIILVHGEANEGVGRLREALSRTYNDGSINIMAPRNCQTVRLEFKAAKLIKAVGNLALTITKQLKSNITNHNNNQNIPFVVPINGLIVRKEFSYSFMMPEELSLFTPITSTTVAQSLVVPFTFSFQCLAFFINQTYEISYKLDEELNENDSLSIDEVSANLIKEEESSEGVYKKLKSENESTEKESEHSGELATTQALQNHNQNAENTSNVEPNLISLIQSIRKENKLDYMVVSGLVLIVRETDSNVVIHWNSNPVNDMISDSIISIICNIQANPAAAKMMGVSRCSGHSHTEQESKIKSAQSSNGNLSSESSKIQVLNDPKPLEPKESGPSPERDQSQPFDSDPNQNENDLIDHNPSIEYFLKQQFGNVTLTNEIVNEKEMNLDGDSQSSKPVQKTFYNISYDQHKAQIDVNTHSIRCNDPELSNRIENLLIRIKGAVKPISNKSFH